MQPSAVSPPSSLRMKPSVLESSRVQLNLVCTGLFLLDAVQSRWIQIYTDVFHLQSFAQTLFQTVSSVPCGKKFSLTEVLLELHL